MGEFSPQKLRELIENSGLSLHQNTRSFIFTCPRCQKKDKLYIRKSDGRFICFVCAEGEGRFRGRAEFAIAELFGWPIREVRRHLYGEDFDEKTVEDFLNFQLYDFFGDTDEIAENVTSTLPTLLWPMDYLPIDHPAAIRGLRYLEQERGVPLDLAKFYGLRYCPPQRRVIFPVETDNRLIGWQARSVIPTEWYNEEDGTIHTFPKILGNKGLRRDICLMFEQRLHDGKYAVVCEGPLDAIKAHLCGGNIATMGKGVSAAQIKAIRQGGKIERIYLALDLDAAAEMDRLCHAFGDLEIYQLLPSPGAKDLGAMTPEMVLEQFQRAKRVDSSTCFVYLRY